MNAVAKPQQQFLFHPDSDAGTKELRFKTPQSLVHTAHATTARQFLLWFVGCWAYQELCRRDPNFATHATGEVEILRSELTQLFGYDIGWSGLLNDLEAMRQAPLHFNMLEKDGSPRLKASGYISEFTVTSSVIRMMLPTVVRESVTNQKIFDIISWSMLRKYSEKWQQTIYLLCVSYSGATRTPEMTLDAWREYGSIDKPDVRTGELPYKTPGDLVRYTITKPVAEMNAVEERPFDIVFVPARKGNKIVSFHFKVIKRDGPEFLSAEELFSAAITPIPANIKSYALSNYSHDEIRLSVERATDYIQEKKSNGLPVDPDKVYNKAIRGNWGRDILEKRQQEEAEEKAKKEKRLAEKKRVLDERIEGAKSDFIRRRTNEIREALSNEEMLVAAEAFYQEIGTAPFSIDLFDVEARRFKNLMTNVKFIAWMTTNFKYEFKQDEFEEYLKSLDLA